MTHLRIELNNGVIEEVHSNVIKKLYDIVHSGNLDLTSNLIGRLHTAATYQDYIDYLEDTFKVGDVKLLIIDAGKTYIRFEDSNVLNILATAYGDGTGVTLSELTSVSEILLLFKNNTNITKFNEFKYFTGITTPAAYWLSDWFSGCTSLTEITIPKNVRSITESAFLGCTSLHTVTFDTGSVVESISGFKDCSNLTNILLPNTVLTVADSAFYGCSSLSIVSGGNVTTIERLAFSSSGITTIDLSNVTSFGNYAFLGCRQLSSIGSLSTNITTIGNEGFSNCSSLVINDLSLPYLTTLGESAFFNVGVKQVSNLGLITSIPYSAFYGCSQLTSVTLPLTVTSIGQRAFYGCSALTSIDLSNITSLGNLAFYGTSLTSVDLSSCTTIETSAFHGCTSLTTVTGSLPANVSTSAFEGCTSLTNIDLSNCTSIGISAFNGCTSLTSIDISGVTEILGNYLNGAFEGCTSLTTVTGMSNPRFMHTFAFKGCTSLGNNLDLVLNLLRENSTKTSVNAGYTFERTKYKSAEIHCQYLLETGYMFGNCPDLKKIDFSDTNGILYTNFCYYSAVETIILPANNPPLFTLRLIPDCYSLTKVIILSSTPPALETTQLATTWNARCLFYVPDAALTTYQTTTGWDTITDRIHGLSSSDLNDITWYTKSNPST